MKSFDLAILHPELFSVVSEKSNISKKQERIKKELELDKSWGERKGSKNYYLSADRSPKIYFQNAVIGANCSKIGGSSGPINRRRADVATSVAFKGMETSFEEVAKQKKMLAWF